MVEIGTAIASARALIDIAKAGLEARDDAKVQAALIDLNAKLLDASTAALDSLSKASKLHVELSQLKEAHASLQRRLDEKDSYRLSSVAFGKHAYELKPELAQQGNQHHYVCQGCFDAGKKFVLQFDSSEHFGSSFFCPGCKYKISY